MADKKQTAAVAPVEAPAENQALATTAFVNELPDYLRDAGRDGLETIAKEDVLIPRLALAQALSPQVTEGTPEYLEGLKPGMLFNSMTGQIYGKEVIVQIVKKDALRAMEFFPQDDGGGVKDPNVPLTDPRCQWGPEGEKPVATIFRDYIARLLPSGELIALSFKSTGIKAAKTLNGLIIMRNKPLWAGAYKITTAMELKPKPHHIFQIDNSGWVLQADAAAGKEVFEAVKDLNTAEQVHRGADPDPSDFPYGADGNREPGADDEM